MMEVNRKDISKLQKILKLNLPYKNRALSGLKLEKTMEILAMRNEYTTFDKIFTDEMKRNLAKWSKRCQLCPCLKV
jgi:hypothetical protein